MGARATFIDGKLTYLSVTLLRAQGKQALAARYTYGKSCQELENAIRESVYTVCRISMVLTVEAGALLSAGNFCREVFDANTAVINAINGNGTGSRRKIALLPVES